MVTETYEALFDLATKAIDAHKKLEHFWRDSDLSAISSMDSDSLVPVLVELIVRRIDIANPFELLIKISPDDALAILERRYLGEYVSPYRKFGGYYFELSLILSDYLEIRGKDCFISEILLNDKFKSKLSDSNAVAAICDALDMDSEAELASFIRKESQKQGRG
jgi:hypothetical protein